MFIKFNSALISVVALFANTALAWNAWGGGHTGSLFGQPQSWGQNDTNKWNVGQGVNQKLGALNELSEMGALDDSVNE